VGAGRLGALAAAAADTWATEIGTLAGGRPRTLLGWRAVPPGTSGAVSAAGTAALVAGAAFVALLAIALGFPAWVALAGLAGGGAGAVADSVLGATVQDRRWCDRCSEATERRTHACGAATRASGGVEWIDNDVSERVCTMTGGAVAWAGHGRTRAVRSARGGAVPRAALTPSAVTRGCERPSTRRDGRGDVTLALRAFSRGRR
jgi:uncharacterized membrane protein